jgi:hypothetical protein
MLPAGSEPAIPASEQPQTYAIDRALTGIGLLKHFSWKFHHMTLLVITLVSVNNKIPVKSNPDFAIYQTQFSLSYCCHLAQTTVKSPQLNYTSRTRRVVWNRCLLLCLNFSCGPDIRFWVTESIWVRLKQTLWTKIVQRGPFRFIRLNIRNVTQVCENYRQVNVILQELTKWISILLVCARFCCMSAGSPFCLTARDSVVCQQPGTRWRCGTRQSIMSREGERWSSVVHRTAFVTILGRNI